MDTDSFPPFTAPLPRQTIMKQSPFPFPLPAPSLVSLPHTLMPQNTIQTPIPDPFAEVEAVQNKNSLRVLSSIEKTKFNSTSRISPAQKRRVIFGSKALRTNIHANENIKKIKTIMGSAGSRLHGISNSSNVKVHLPCSGNLLENTQTRVDVLDPTVARLEGISKSFGLKVDFPDSVIVSGTQKRRADWEARVPEVKRARRDETPNALSLPVGFSDGVSASGTRRNAEICAMGSWDVDDAVGGMISADASTVWSEEGLDDGVELSEAEHMMAKLNESCLQMEMDYLEEISRGCGAAAEMAWARAFPHVDLRQLFPSGVISSERNPFSEVDCSILDDYTKNADPELTKEQHWMARENEARLQIEVEYLEELSRKHAQTSRAQWKMAYPHCARYYASGSVGRPKSVVLDNKLPSDACLSVDGAKYRYVRC